MPQANDTWLRWDAAWENGLLASKRLEILNECTAPHFTYTNPNTAISGNLEELANYIGPTLEAAGGGLQVKHLAWYENNDRSALHWDMMDTNTDKALIRGWSYGQYDEQGRLICVADFW